eukprot:Mrub_02102.p1 GENE.Mrub_02102~~Mrub_02102.p1  ORF type:complete len:389 (-),score=188.29 Mrub_02102:200-1366(-)
MTTAETWYKGRYLTIKYIDAYGDNENVDVGTLGVVGTRDTSARAVPLGPVAAQFGVVQGPAPLVFRTIDEDEVDVVNSRKCLVFLSAAAVDWVEEVAAACKDSLTTFLVDGAERMPSSLTNYLFKQVLNDAVIVTDMSAPGGPKGYKYHKELSSSSQSEVQGWIDLVQNNAALFDDLDALEKDLEQLVKLLKTKDDLSPQQMRHGELSESLETLRQSMCEDANGVPAKVAALKTQLQALRATLDPRELLFGTAEDFACVNAAGETKSVSALLEGKSHLLVYFSAHWCPPCRSFTPVLAQAYRDSANQNVEVLFLSSDSSASEFQSYLAEMPWWAMSYDRRDLKEAIAQQYGCSGIPMLVCLKTDGSLVSASFRNDVSARKAEALDSLV